MCVTFVPFAELPSPNCQSKWTGSVPPVAWAVRLNGSPVSTIDADWFSANCRVGLTVTLRHACTDWWSESFAHTSLEYGPGSAKVWDRLEELACVPSPRIHEKVYGGVPHSGAAERFRT